MGVARTGVLLLNLGTPASPDTADVRRYLREFLSDPRVLDMNGVLRALLLHGVILRTRPRRSAAAYAKVWGPGGAEGSPLLRHGIDLRDALAEKLGPDFQVELGMRYGEPSIASVVAKLVARNEAFTRFVVVPLFPQYADASTGSALARLFDELPAKAPPIRTLAAFYDRPGYIDAWADVARGPLEAFAPDHVLLSYHGLPERQVRRTDPSAAHCLERADCCDAISPVNRSCYRAQCFATSRALADALPLTPGAWSLAFQSRLGRTPWIQPFSDERLPKLAAEGIRRLAVLCPAFVADCLETLEEVGIRMRDQWTELGGEDLLLVPCPNAHPTWVEALATWVREAAP